MKKKRKKPCSDESHDDDPKSDRDGTPPECSTTTKKFEVRNMSETSKVKGVGIFSLQNILCGDVIVEEFPIVSALSPFSSSVFKRKNLCGCCFTPIGNLREHLLSLSHNSSDNKHDEKNIEFPILHVENGPNYQSKKIDQMWCSLECKQNQDIVHQLVLCPLEFREHAASTEHEIEFLLAAQSMAVIISAVIRDVHNSEKRPEKIQSDDQRLLWWKEYNHPLWWDIGKDTQIIINKTKKKDLCEESHRILLKTLLHQAKKLVSSILHDTSSLQEYIHDIISSVCTLQNYSEVLGMLKCNVMEIEFPSPISEYISHLQDTLEELEDVEKNQNILMQEEKQNDDDFDKGAWDETMANIKEEKDRIDSWLKSHSNLEELVTQPISGSGLFPILTLANHDCNPNASIEFLQESNKGSLVALRNIGPGEEICITYVPNGDFHDEGSNDDTGDRFKHFQPTRTWKFLNENNNNSDDGNSSDEDKNESDNDNEDGNYSDLDKGRSDFDHEIEQGKNNDAEEQEDEEGGGLGELSEGASYKDRAVSLLEYGFVCECSRCRREKDEETTCDHV